MLGGKRKHIDAAQRAIGCFSNRTLDGGNTISIGRLPEHTEECFDLAHVNAPVRSYPSGLAVASSSKWEGERASNFGHRPSSGSEWRPRDRVRIHRRIHEAAVWDVRAMVAIGSKADIGRIAAKSRYDGLVCQGPSVTNGPWRGWPRAA